jgi:YbbR domain-containing protein
MKNSKMADFFGSRIFCMIVAVIAAIALWMYVAYVDNSDFTSMVSGIPVEFTGEEELTAHDLIITKITRSEVSVRFSGKRSAISKLSDKNLSVTVDLTEIIKYGSAGTYQIQYKINYPSGVDYSSLSVLNSTNYITVTVDELVSSTVEVRGGYNGSIADGYQAEPIEINPDTIQVSGPKETVSQISYAWVVLNKDEYSKTVSEDLEYTLVDENENEISKEGLTFDTETVNVTLPIVMVKEVALTVNVLSGAGASLDDGNVTVDIQPASIMLVGDAEILSGVNQILLGTIDLSKFTSSTTETFKIIIPNDVINQTGDTEATVTVTISGLSTKKLSATNISTINDSEGYYSTIITQSLDITLRGSSDELRQVTAENIRIVGDMSELGQVTGSCTLTAKVYVDGFNDVGAVGVYTITVMVNEGTPESDNE